MTRPCPLRCIEGWCTLKRRGSRTKIRRCLPCRGTGRITIIAPGEHALQAAGWLTPSDVVAMKADGRLPSKTVR